MSHVYFAWVAPETAFNAATHNVDDEEVFSINLIHEEGDFAQLDVEIINPRVGFLSAGRDQWAWVSYENDAAEITPLFYGRLIAVPANLQDEIVRLTFIARPVDYEDTKATLAETLKVDPYWDPLFVSEDARDDPDTVLEARPELWHIDRVTHAVTTSNIIEGEAGEINLAGAMFYDSLSVSYSGTPGRIARVVAEVKWKQYATADIDISDQFPNPMETYSVSGLVEDWPKPEQKIGSHWAIVETEPLNNDGISFRSDEYIEVMPDDGQPFRVYKGVLNAYMVVRYEVSRDFTERLTFDLPAGVQPLLTEPGDEEIVIINLAGEADSQVDREDGASGSSGDPQYMPIRNLRSRAYFKTDRGQRSVRFALMVARAQLLARARCVDISFTIPFETGLPLTLRHNVTVSDGRLPGGGATGKAKALTLRINGDTGEAVCDVTIACTIGTDGTAVVSSGTPIYVDTGYIGSGYVMNSGQTYAALDGEITYPDMSGYEPADDGTIFDNIDADAAVETLEVFNTATEQEVDWTQIGGYYVGFADVRAMIGGINAVKTEIEIDFLDFDAGPFETVIPIEPSELAIPKTIDLEAT